MSKKKTVKAPGVHQEVKPSLVQQGKPTLAQQAQATVQDQSANFMVIMAEAEAGKIWGEIKDRPIEMFALPGQQVQMHCRPVPVDPARLFLLPTSTAVLPSLEAAIGNRYAVELADKYIIVTRAPVSFTKK